MACTAKHTKYQPVMPDEWRCPRCGAGSEIRGPEGERHDGFLVQDADETAADDCDLNHDGDNLGCNRCEFGCSGAAFARRLQKAKNLVPCSHCKGSGLVPRGADHG
jgi:hypothetical protein